MANRSRFVVVCLVVLCGVLAKAQSVTTALATFSATVPKADSLRLHRDFDAVERTDWDRIARRNRGVDLAELPPEARMAFNNLLRASLSTKGYQLVLGIVMDDIGGSTCFEASLNQEGGYWLEVFGDPQRDPYWSYHVQGHHLSLNLTFAGDELVSHTPFFFGAAPQVPSTGNGRQGQSLVYEEEYVLGQLIDSLPAERRGRAYATAGIPDNLFGDAYLDTLYAPQGGIALWRLAEHERAVVDEVLDTYADYFLSSALATLAFPDDDPVKLIFHGSTATAGQHYYCIGGGYAQIECLNFGNHTHHLWRCDNDFGAAALRQNPSR